MNKIKIEKIVVNVGIGRLGQQANFKDKIVPEITKELAMITGQRASLRGTKKSIAGFKTRLGDIVGMKVTLRKKRMLDFLSRLINIAIPRVKDFRGIDLKNIDQNGNLNIGFKEQYIFPEIKAEESKVHFGLQVTIVPSSRNKGKIVDFYRSLGIPLRKSQAPSTK
ncbi:MAG: 50S ribosomal protein L5 [Patescibacteria group bacterium]|mgnify:CR=1